MGRRPKFDAPVEAPLHERGRRLYEVLAPTGSNLAQQAIALEAARLADRLDALNAAIESDGVIELMHYRMRGEISEEGVATIVVTVDGVLGEARQTAGQFERVLRAALAGVDLAKPNTGGGAAGGVDELKQRREAERAKRGVSA